MSGFLWDYLVKHLGVLNLIRSFLDDKLEIKDFSNHGKLKPEFQCYLRSLAIP